MKFPVDLLAHVSQAELEQSAHGYMNKLLFSNPDSPERLTLSDSTQVTVDISRVGFVPLYGSSDKQKILAVFSPSDPLTAVALYLLHRWWTVDEILKTADPSRNGTVEVKTVGERIVLYILNRVIYRAKEMSSDELPFLCHGEHDYAKILWSDGEAVGFYSVKPAGRLWNAFSTRRYQLPVMDSIFVRKSQRGNGFGLQMLEDYVLSFKENSLGLRYPLPTSMYKVCEKYLCQYPGDTELLWEVESVGEPNQRTNLFSKIQSMDLSAVSKSLSFTEESLAITQVAETEVVMDIITTQVKEDGTGSRVEIVEEVTVLRATNGGELPVTARGRSSGSKRRKTEESSTEDKSGKVIRIEDIEAETPQEKHDLLQQTTEMADVSEIVQTEDIFSLAPKENGEGFINTTPDAAAILASEASVTSTPIAEELQIEDDAKQSVNSTSSDSQITVENVASEIEESKEDLEEDHAVLEVSEEVIELQEEAQTLSKVGEGKVLRRRTVTTTATTTSKYTRHSQKVCEESDKNVDEVTEENVVCTTEVVVELDVNVSDEPKESAAVKEDVLSMGDLIEGKQQQEEEDVTHELQTEEQEGPVLNESFSVLSDTAEDVHTEGTGVGQVKNESEGKQGEEEHTSDVDDDQDVPPVVHRRSLRGRCKVVPKAVSTKQSKTYQRHKGEHADETTVETEESASEANADEKAMEQMGKHPLVDEDKSTTNKLNVAEEGCIPGAEEATVDITPSTEVCTKECKVVLEHARPEAIFVSEGGAGSVIQESLTVTAASGAAMLDEVLDKTVLPAAVEPQGKDTDHEMPKLQQATVVLVDLKSASHQLSESNAVETPAQGVYSVLDNGQVKMMAPEEEQTRKPEILVLEGDDEEKKENTGERSADAETDDKECLNEDTVDADNSGEEAEAPFVDTKVLRSGRKIVKANQVSQECEDDDTGKLIDNEQDEAATTGNGEDMEAMKTDSATKAVPQEEGNVCEEIETVSPTVEDAKENLSPAKIDEKTSQEEAQVSTRALRSKTKTITATPVHKKARKQVHTQEGGDSEEDEEPAVTTRTLRHRRISAPATPKGKPRRSGKQNQKGERREPGESPSVQGTEEKAVGVMEAAVEYVQSSTASEEKIEQQTEEEVEENAASEGEAAGEQLDSEKDEEQGVTVEEGGREATEEQSEAVSTTCAEIEAEATGEESDEEKAVSTDEEMKHTPAVVTRSLRSGAKTPSALPSSRSRRQKDKKEDEVDKAAGEDEKQLENEEPVIVEGASEMETIIKEGENTAFAENLRQDQNDTAVSTSDSDLETLSKEDSAEEHLSKNTVPQLSDLQRVTVVLVDLKNNSHEVQEEAAVVEESTPVVITATEAEEANKEEMVEEENVPGHDSAASALDERRCTIETTQEPLQEEEEGGRECVREREGMEEEEQKPDVVVLPEEEQASSVESVPGEDTEVSVGQNAEAEKASEDVTVESVPAQAGDEEQLSKEDNKKEHVSEVEETPVEDTGVLRSGEKTVTTVEKVQMDDEDTTGEKSMEDEPTVETRVLRKGRRSAAATRWRKSKRVCTQSKEEGEEQTAPAQETQEEEPRTVLEDNKEGNKGEKTKENIENKAEALREDNAGSQEDNEDETEVSEDQNTEDEPTVETRTLRKRRRPAAAATPQRKSKRFHTECKEGPEAHTEESTELEDELKTSEAVAEESLTEPVTAEEEQSAALETSANEQEETCAGENAEVETNTEEEEASDEEEEAPVVVTRVLRSHGRVVEVSTSSQTVDGQQDESQEEVAAEMASDTDEPTIKTRAARKGRRSAAATPQRKSKRVSAGFKEGPEAHTEETTEESSEQEDESKTEDAVAEESLTKQVTAEEEQSAVLETSANEQEETCPGENAGEETNTEEGKASDEEEEAPVVVTRVLRSHGKVGEVSPSSQTVEDRQDESQEEVAAEMASDTDEPTVGTRTLRKRRRSGAATPRRKSKRVNAGFKEGPEDQTEETTEESSEQEDESKTEDAVAEESLTEPVTAEEEQSAVLETSANEQEETCAGENAGEETNTEEEEASDEEEEAPVVVTRVLRSHGRVGEVSPSSQTVEDQQDDNQEEVAVEMASDTDEPTIKTRAARKGRRSAAATPQRKSKRVSAECKEGPEAHTEESPELEEGLKTSEAVAEDSLTEPVTAEEEQSAILETSANEQEETCPGENAGEETNTEEGKASDEEEEAPVVVTVEMASDTNEPTIKTRAARKGRRSAAATPRNRTKSARTPLETEEEGKEDESVQTLSEEEEEKAEKENASMDIAVKMDNAEETEEKAAMDDSERMKEDSTEHSAVLEMENSITAVDETSADTVEVQEAESGEEQESTAPDVSTAAPDVGSHSTSAEEEPPATDKTEATEDEVPSITSRSLRSKTRTSQRPSKQEEQGAVETQVSENLESETQEEHQLSDGSVETGKQNAQDQAETNEASLVGPPAGDGADDRTKETADLTDDAECTTPSQLSSAEEHLENNEGAVESTSDQENILSSEPDAEKGSAGLASEGEEEDEQCMSEEEAEPIVIGKKVLRGRTIPSMIITPHSTPRRRSAKGPEKLLSDEKKSHSPVQKRSPRKRRSAEVSPAPKSKRRSRV